MAWLSPLWLVIPTGAQWSPPFPSEPCLSGAPLLPHNVVQSCPSSRSLPTCGPELSIIMLSACTMWFRALHHHALCLHNVVQSSPSSRSLPAAWAAVCWCPSHSTVSRNRSGQTECFPAGPRAASAPVSGPEGSSLSSPARPFPRGATHALGKVSLTSLSMPGT